jgi:hypothetical protein
VRKWPTGGGCGAGSVSSQSFALAVGNCPMSVRVAEVIRNHYNVRLGLDCVAKVVLHPRSKILKAAGAAFV